MTDKPFDPPPLMTKWRTIESDYIVNDRWFVLRADRCETAEKQTIDPYYVIEAKDSVHLTILNDRYEVLLTYQYRHGAQIESLEFPCGEIEPGESPEVTAKRELMEETGYAVHTINTVGSFYSNPARQTNRAYTLLGTGAYLVAEQKLDDTESIKFGFFSIAELEHFITTGQFSQGLHIGSWYQVLKLSPVDIRKEIRRCSL